ncbi:response regulator [Vibrio alginolyticus]
MSKQLTILIADTQPIYREGLSAAITQRMDVNEIIFARTQAEVLTALRNHTIDLIVMDVVLQDCNGLQLAKSVFRRDYQGAIVFLTAQDNNHYSKLASQIGAHGCLSKDEDSQVVIDALISASKGYRVFKNNFVSDSITLSMREQVVLDYLMKGYNNKKIANILSLSDKTVSTYKQRVLKKFNVSSLMEAASLNQASAH